MDKLIRVLKEVLECQVDENTSMDTCEEWDSMNHVNIILELQDSYSMKIPSLDIDKLKSVKSIKEYLDSREIK